MAIWRRTAAGGLVEQGSIIYRCTTDGKTITSYVPQKTIWRYTATGGMAVVWTAEEQVHPGVTPTTRVYANGYSAAGPWYAYSNPGPYSDGASACAYTTINVTSFSRVTLVFTLTNCPQHGHIAAGFGNFSSFSLAQWPTITHGYGFDTIKQANGYYTGQVITLNIDTSGMSGNYECGVASVYRSSAGVCAYVTLNSLICYP